MNAIDELIAEHEAVRLTLQILKKIGQHIEESGQIPDTRHVEQLFDFFTTFVDRCHHGKEEELLFPALESVGISRQGGPVGVMLEEHQQGRELVAKMKNELARYTQGDNRAAPAFKKYADAYIGLLNFHIEKENNVLFPMAIKYLPGNKLAGMKTGFDRIESEKIGVGKHEQFHQMLADFEKQYLQ